MGNFTMARQDKHADDSTRLNEIRAAIQDQERLVIDSGQRRWLKRTGRYEIVWESAVFGKTFH
jgi:hypothetical protein